MGVERGSYSWGCRGQRLLATSAAGESAHTIFFFLRCGHSICRAQMTFFPHQGGGPEDSCISQSANPSHLAVHIALIFTCPQNLAGPVGWGGLDTELQGPVWFSTDLWVSPTKSGMRRRGHFPKGDLNRAWCKRTGSGSPFVWQETLKKKEKAVS